MEITPRRRRALSTALAVVLAIESVSAVAAAAQISATRLGAPDAGPAAPAAIDGAAVAGLTGGGGDGSAAIAGAGVADYRLPEPVAAPTEPAQVPAAVERPETPRAAIANVAKVAKPSASTGTTRSSKSGPVERKGRNHLWIPSLGINRSVQWFPCDRSRPPDNYVYRWGCAGSNNVYLMGHAHSVFKPLHDAYANGRLRKGMKAYYADSKGKVRVYVVRWWKVTAPTTEASWAWASLATPSMTLQTCVGRNGQYRLMVRLVQVDG